MMRSPALLAASLVLACALCACDRGAARKGPQPKRPKAGAVAPRPTPPKKRPGKPFNRGPDPAPLSYPVKVKAGGKVLTYDPNDTGDSEQKQLTIRHEDKAQVMGLLPIKQGMTVADVGCGAGYFTPDLAKLVGARGRVWALDIKQQLIRDLVRRLRKEPALDPNRVIRPRVSALDDIGLPPSSVDVLYLAHLDFYLHAPLSGALARFIKSSRRAMRRDGRLVILQWMQVPSQVTDDKGKTVPYSAKNLLQNMAAVGLVKETEHDIRSPRDASDRTKLFVFKSSTNEKKP